MAKKIPDKIQYLFTKKRKFISENGKVVEKDFKPILQNINEEEVLYIYEKISGQYGKTFTIDFGVRLAELGWKIPPASRDTKSRTGSIFL